MTMACRQRSGVVMNQRESIVLAVRIGTAMVVVALSVIALTSTLSLFRFEETYKALVEQRMKLTAGEVARVLSVGLDLGLPVDAQENIPGLLRQRLAAHADLASITVRDCGGQVLFQAGEPMTTDASALPWPRQQADQLDVSMRVTDATGGCAADLVVTRAAAPFRQAMALLSRNYLTLGAWVAGLTSLAMIGAALVFSRSPQTLRALDADLDALARDDEPKGTAGVEDVVPGNAWEADLLEAYRAARPVLAAARRAGSE